MNDLPSLVETKSNDVRVDHAQIERCQEWVGVGEGNEHSIVDQWTTLVNITSGLVSVTGVITSDLEGSVSQIQLIHPSNESRCASRGRCKV